MIRSTKLHISFSVVLVVAGVLGVASYLNTQRLIRDNEWVIHTHKVMEALGDILSQLKDAETGQRGFILTGQDRYLDPYNQAHGAIDVNLAALMELTNDTHDQKTELLHLKALIDSKLDELKQTIELRRKSGLEAAMPIIAGDRGKIIMDDIRELIAQMQRREQDLLQLQQKASASSARWTILTIAGGIPLSMLVFAIATIILVRSGRAGDFVVSPPEEVSSRRRIAARYAFAVVAVVLASILRGWLLHIGPAPLFITFYPAVLLVAMVAGGSPGIVTTILSGLAVSYYFIPPYEKFAIESPGDVVALAIFTATNLSLCVVAERLRRSRWAEAFSLAKQQEAEELTRKNEELAQQSEELSQQSEELAQQNEELQSQSEEIQTLNIELTGREDMLRKLLEATRLPISEESVLKDICVAAKEIFNESASAVVICQKHENELLIRAQAGSPDKPKPWPIEGAFPGLVMQESRTVCLNDASLRPDLKLLQIAGEAPFQAALSSPLRVAGELFGAVTIYSRRKQEWTTEQFRLVEWLATQCGHILETLRLQDQLRRAAEQNRLLSDLLEHSEQPFGIGYPDGKLGYINSAYERLTGYSRKELESMDWVEVLTPPQWKPIERIKLDELYHTGQPVRYEKEYARKDGTRVPIELLVHLIRDGQGLPLYYYSFVTDISERKQTESEVQRITQQHQLALDAAKLGWWHFDPSTRIASYDARYREIFGVAGHSSPIDEILKHLNPEDLPGVWAKVEAALNPADPKSYSAEYRIHFPDGSMKWIEAHGIATFEGSGPQRRAVSLVGTVADISERKRAEESLARAKNELEQRVAERTAQLRALAGELTLSEQRERSRLAKILHDHLQQLLVAAKFRLAILGKGAEDLMKQAIKEVEELIDESISSSRSLTAELSPPILHAAGLKAGLEWLSRRMADRQGLLVDLELEEIGDLPDDLKILLFESVRELLFNVAKHAHTRSSTVNLKRVDGFLQLAVSDQGVGFDPGVTSRPGESGKGFGLFSVRERLGLFGGKLEIQSAPGSGSRVFLSVPIPHLEAVQPNSIPATVFSDMSIVRRIPESDSGKRIQILLVDDHAVVRQGMANMLSNEADFQIIGQASDGQEAVELAAKLLPDVILMDMSMPRLNGAEATRIIHNEFPEIRIIGLSMFEETERAQAMRAAGAVHYMTKSGAAGALIEAIRKFGVRVE
jgi:PAS domain S-box-containing protein